MSLTLRATLLVLVVSVCGQAQTRTLAVYAGSAPGLDAESTMALHAEVQRLLAPADFAVVWRSTADRKAGEDFEVVVVASFDGWCSNHGTPGAPVTASLADTSISDGRILPFFRVDCARLIPMLGLQPDSTVIGRALGRVIAHEIYHIVTRTTAHHDTGVAKAAFSTRDLTSPRFEFDPWSLSRMRPAAVSSLPINSEVEAR